MSLTNPGNLNQAAGAGWEGSVKGQTDRNGHAIFEDYQGIPAQAWGVRAMVRNLQQYHFSGKRSLEAIIGTWAPAGDRGNDPSHYAATLAKWLDVGAQQELWLFTQDGKSLWHLARLVKLIYYIAIFENGHNYILPLSNILLGIGLAQRKWFEETVGVQ